MRKEQDALGKLSIPGSALYGIHSQRARENFPDRSPFNLSWYRALGTVKLACYKTYEKFIFAARQKYPDKNLPVREIDDSVVKQIIISAEEISSGKYFEHFIVPGISGGAGTNINMNINQIIAITSLVRMGKKPGDYAIVHSIEHANIFQSPNDVVRTALKPAIMELMALLEKEINGLRKITEAYEKNYRENLPDNTANIDSLVEVHAILKANAVNLEKMVSDLRLLSSDLIPQKEVIPYGYLPIATVPSAEI